MPENLTCREQILSEEYMDFITNSRSNAAFDSIPFESTECKVYLGGPFNGIFMNNSEVGRRELNRFPYFSIPKCYTLLDVDAMSQAGIVQIQNYPGLELMGDGVLIGIIDTGIEYENSIFRNLDGTTRILSIWDQTIQDGEIPEDFGYGSVYSKTQIDEALRGEEPKQVVPSTDTNGHGTFVTSLACGGADVENRFIGAAPESAIGVVKLKEAKQYLRDYYYIDADAACYQENDIMAAVRYLDQLALEQDMPLVLCLALGTSMGGHNGASPLGNVLELMATITQKVVVLGNGNEADKRHHYMETLTAESEGTEVEIRVGNNTRGFVLELWTQIPNILEATIISPTGERIGTLSIRQREANFTFVFERTEVFAATRLLVERTSSELIFLQFDRPSAGIWKVVVKPLQIGSGIFHMWLPMEEFLTGEVYFLRSNPDYTVTEPGNVYSAITPGYYNGADNSIAISSGRGYTRGERIKPEFVAPGVNVSGLNQRGQFTSRTGSSNATAITAGAAALMLEWIVVRLGESVDTLQVKNLLILGTQRRSDITYPNKEWGYGTMNLYRTFEELRRF